MPATPLTPNPSLRLRYTALSPEQQNFLKMLSICFAKTSRAKIRTCLGEARVKNDAGLVFKTTDLKPIVTVLSQEGFIEADSLGVRCRPDSVEYVSCEAMSDGSFATMAAAVATVIPTKNEWEYEHHYNNYDLAIRDLRLALYLGRQAGTVRKFLGYCSQANSHRYEGHLDPLFTIFTAPLNSTLLYSLRPEVCELVLSNILNASVLTMTPAPELFSILQELYKEQTPLRERLQPLLLFQYLLRGSFSSITALVKEQENSSESCYAALLSLLNGERDQAIAYYETALGDMAARTTKSQAYFSNFVGLFYVVALLGEGGTGSLKKGLTYLNRLLKNKKEHLFFKATSDLKQTLLALQGQKGKADKIHHSSSIEEPFPDYLTLLMSYLTLHWQGEDILEKGQRDLALLIKASNSCSLHWITLQATAILARTSSKSVSEQDLVRLQELCPQQQLLIDLVPSQEKWQQVLDALLALHPEGPVTGTDTASRSRLVWLVAFSDDPSAEITLLPRLQKQNKSGGWSKGRAVALKALRNNQNLDYLSDQDRRLCGAIKVRYESTGYYYSRKKVYRFDLNQAIPILIDHPLLFSSQNPSQALEFVSRVPELHITEGHQGYTMHLEPGMDPNETFLLIPETMSRTGVVQMSSAFRQVAEIINSQIEVPRRAKEQVLKVISTLTPHLAIHTDIAGVSQDIEEITADPTPYFHLIPYGNGLRAENLVRPLPEGDIFQHPGLGGKVVLAEIAGTKLQAQRDLPLERQQSRAAIAQCGVLARLDDGSGEWLIDDPQECLELVDQLQAHQDVLKIQWPQGKQLRLSATIEASAFSLHIKKENDWFGVSGQLKIDADTVIEMEQLLALSRNSSSRFIQMDDGTFLALSKTLKRRIDELDAYTETQGRGLRLSPLASLALEDLTTEIGELTGDKHWHQNLQRFRDAPHPPLPTTFQAELREYQLTGFHWLATLAQWQVGACLADDMGLGKTVQALAAILLRAPQGPTLIIAPTSVLMNWSDEAARFAPTLTVKPFGPGDRKEMLDQLEPFDMVVSSYGLLQTEGARLAGVRWQTVVLDEAQAIKNMATKRSKAAMALQAHFRLITTGTPIENHLGELWNLFQFINPGLLGSADAFNRKFAIPIERDQDRLARGRLKKLIQPFILRRLKRDVLQELPPRTEVTLLVKMSPKESALYEAQRLQALEKIDSAAESGTGQHMQILAEITRLRRFCCHPKLVLPDWELSSSKLDIFRDTVTELLDNGHKALVFSQFVGHLAILRNFLEEQKIPYQYLDGSTPVKKRQQRIHAFQAGEGDIFLISLKAGGSGLNLTAADYVIHMDPWWNPAVEDQASDRAHRIGQRRPVTVYRLVVKDSIEEKIIALHAKKRDLADSLLEGSDMSGKVTTSQLLELMKG